MIGRGLEVLDEPSLEFRYGQMLTDPRDGLSLFGPYDGDAPGHPASVSYGLVGTQDGIELFLKWSEAMVLPRVEAPRDRHRLWPPYPGFEVAFGSTWQTQPVWKHTIDGESLLDVARRHDPYERCYSVVDHYLEAFSVLEKLDQHVPLMVCVVPEQVYQTCRPQSRVTQPTGERVSRRRREQRRRGQSEMFSRFQPEQYELSPDFRRQLKARVMAHNTPVQIVRESALRLNDDNPIGMRQLTPMSDRMWNLGSAMYYKGGGKPWKLGTAREGVCYVGLAFRKADHESPETAVCAAQMFLDDGDGVVFLGNYGPWYSPERRQFHLSGEAAHDLLKGALDTYAQLHGKTLSEVFLHSRSEISDEEFEGYRTAVPAGCQVVGVRVRTDRNGVRLFRPGKNWPVLRGSFWQHSSTRGYLFASGFKPRLGTYDGWETPAPLQIDVQHGEADVLKVARDIMGLSKLNYNACNSGESQPVTVKFSDAVGEILVSNPKVTDRQPTFKFYI